MSNPYEYKKGKYLDIQLGGEATRLHPGNAHVFTHTKQPDGNHIYVLHRELPDESVEASYLWQLAFKEQGREDKYEKLVRGLGNIGCNIHEATFMSEGDTARFQDAFNRYPGIILESFELTDRHENLVRSLGRVLKQIPTRDLHEEMQLPHDYRPYPSRWA